MDLMDLKSIKSIIHGFEMDLDSPKKSMRSMQSMKFIELQKKRSSSGQGRIKGTSGPGRYLNHGPSSYSVVLCI